MCAWRSSSVGFFLSAAMLCILPKKLPHFLLGSVERPLADCGQAFSRAVDIEIEHGHRRLERRSFSARALFRRALQRPRDLLRVPQRKDAGLRVKRVAFS